MAMWQGFFWGMVASCSFGLIPLFSLPVLHEGMAPSCVLVYRFGLASLLLLGILLGRGRPVVIGWRDMGKIGGLCLLYACSSITFMVAFLYMESGLVATLHFSYPIYVVLFMCLFFKEKVRWSTALAIGMTCSGVALLALPHDGFSLNPVGLVWALGSAVLNAGYITSIQVVRLKVQSGLTVTFYIMVFGALYCGLFSLGQGTLTLPAHATSWGHLALLAAVTAVLSNVALVLGIRYIGATLASVIGALEPLTAVVVGILAFGEACTLRTALATCIIIGAVLVIMLAPHLHRRSTQHA